MDQRFSVMLFFVVGMLLVSLPSGAQEEQLHPGQMSALSIDAEFPRCSEAQLKSSGFPDHMHAQWWPNWEVLVDDEGITYGPGAFCRKKVLIPREGLLVEPGRNSYGLFVTLQHKDYGPCDMISLLENLDWAERVLSEMLGLVPTDTLTVISPDTNDQYQQLTGNGMWRLYKLMDDTCIIEPYGTLQARTLDTHAMFMLVTDWILKQKLPVPLPSWMHVGLTEYMSEDGAHLTSYMGQFRSRDPFFLSPSSINQALDRAPVNDADKDREMFRRASYNAFLMVWDLVENRGGLQAMREFLVLAGEGVELDRASRKVYGLDMKELAEALDPTVNGEPIDKNTKFLRPMIQPQKR